MIFQSSVSIIPGQSQSVGTMLTQTNGVRMHRLDSKSQQSQNVSWVHGDENLSLKLNNVFRIMAFTSLEFV